MRFLITGMDICGRVVLRRKTATDALKKAAELAQDGYREISITAPDGHKYPSQKFDRLPEDG
jgi:tRNA A37 methylthiotransferase MiaB